MSNEIVVQQQDTGIMQLAQNMQILKARMNIMRQATKEILVESVDFGAIPGAGDKPTLLKPGAEKLCFLFGLRPTFELRDSIEDWAGGLFYYRYACVLHSQDGEVLADGEGSCNSREVKYRYRQGERKCPNCGKSAIIKGKSEYGGGWVCFAKKGGCGAKFKDGDASIEGQETGRVENPDPADLVNTIQKMAQKRALVAAVLVGAGASQFFTQDVEDMTYTDTTPVVKPVEKPQAEARNTARRPVQPKPQPVQTAQAEPAPVVVDAETGELEAGGMGDGNKTELAAFLESATVGEKRKRATDLWRKAKAAGLNFGAYTDESLNEWIINAEAALAE